jgi:hypothetical protein
MRTNPKVAAALCASLLASCGGGGGGTGGTGTLMVTMHDSPVDSAEHVFVTVERVEVFRHDAEGAEVRETLVDVPQQHDLLALQNGVEAVLGTATFPAGDYTSIRLIVAADSPEDVESLPADALNNYIVIDGTAHPLIVPSGAQTGIKMNHSFTLAEGQITVLTFDFDVRRSVTRRGQQDLYNLRPTLRLVDTVVSGTASGTVTTADPALAVPPGTVVTAFQAGAPVASGPVDETTGAYVVGPLLAGTYDLVVSAPGFAFESISGVAVVAEADASGNDFAIDAAATGGISGTVTPASESATVTLLWSGFAVATTSVDPATGVYAFDGLPVGDYVVNAADGTATASSPATVTDGVTTTVDLSL